MAKNPFNADPTRTTSLRKSFMRQMNKRVRTLKSNINKLINVDDVFGLKSKGAFTLNVEAREWQFLTDVGKIERFNEWLQRMINEGLLESDGPDAWTSAFIKRGFEVGIARAVKEVNKTQDISAGTGFFNATVDTVSAGLVNAPKSIDKARMLATRVFENLKGITADVSLQLNRILADGFIQGLGPREIARQMNKSIDSINKRRALTLARTEIVHAHAEGQLDGFEALGVEELELMAEWHTAGDSKVCELCAPLAKEIMTIEQARGLIPRHPNCRCAWLPSFPDVEQGTRAQSRKSLQRSIKKSVEASSSKDRWRGKFLFKG